MNVIENRLYIDLIHAKAFNSKQREMVKEAISKKLNISQLKEVSRSTFSAEHMKEMIDFFATAKYKDNKQLYKMFLKDEIDVKILHQINLGLAGELVEETILKYAQPDIYSPEQMNELRMFIKADNFTDDYYIYIFDRDKSAQSMASIREAVNMEIPFEELSRFNPYSELFPSMVKAITNGILPDEVLMSLEVTNEPKRFEGIMNGISQGLSDEEIQSCLSGDDRHFDSYIALMGEIHDINFMDKVIKIKELPRRQLIEDFNTEEKLQEYILQIYDSNMLSLDDQVEFLMKDCGTFIDITALKEANYIERFVDKTVQKEKKLREICLRAYLSNEISNKFEVIGYHPDAISMKKVLLELFHNRYDDLVNQKTQMNYFLSNLNNMDTLLANSSDIQQNEEYLSFDMTSGFTITLKEYKDYYDVEKVTLAYGSDRVCELSKQQIEEQAIEYRKVRMNDKGIVPKLPFQKDGREI